VHVGGSPVANGFAIEIEDRGLGMPEADLATANARLAEPPDFNLANTARLGLYVVGRLAQRHGIRVQLRESPYGGTTAIVLIPASLVTDATGTLEITDRRDRAAIQPAAPESTVDSLGPGSTVDSLSSGSTVDSPGSTVDSLGPGSTVDSPGPGTAGALAEPTDLPTRRRQAAGTARPAPVPDDGGPGPEPAETTIYTSAGLPWRTRQASLSRPPRPQPNAPRDTDDEPAAPRSRPPEQIRQMMTAYQSGTRLGRSAARQAATEAGSAAPATGPDETPA
jgi:hypothetical protein